MGEMSLRDQFKARKAINTTKVHIEGASSRAPGFALARFVKPCLGSEPERSRSRNAGRFPCCIVSSFSHDATFVAILLLSLF